MIVKISPKAILFDLDGTLLDTAPEFVDCINQLRVELGLLPSIVLADIRPAVSHGVAAVIKIAIPLSLTEVALSLSTLTKRFFEIHQSNIGNNTQLFPGVEDLLIKIENLGLKWGVVTNKYQCFTYPLLDKLNLTHRAHVIVSGDTLQVSKPDPLPLLYACEQLGVAPEACYYVGDAERDIVAGKAAGMLSNFVALYGYLAQEDLPEAWGADYYIQHPKDILPF